MTLVELWQAARSLWVVWLLLLFLGIVVWVMWPRNRKKYEDAAQIPLRDGEED